MKSYFIFLGLILSFFMWRCGNGGNATDADLDIEEYHDLLADYYTNADTLLARYFEKYLDNNVSVAELEEEYYAIKARLEENLKSFDKVKQQEDILYPAVKEFLSSGYEVYTTECKKLLDLFKSDPGLEKEGSYEQFVELDSILTEKITYLEDKTIEAQKKFAEENDFTLY